MTTLAKMIRDARTHRGMTQLELGKAIGISSERAAQVAISKYERGITIPHENLANLIRVLKLPRKRVVALVLERAFDL
jgi:transcriptional regulator with XRE-family HTH domain